MRADWKHRGTNYELKENPTNVLADRKTFRSGPYEQKSIARDKTLRTRGGIQLRGIVAACPTLRYFKKVQNESFATQVF